MLMEKKKVDPFVHEHNKLRRTYYVGVDDYKVETTPFLEAIRDRFPRVIG
jgi:hypothetical protein